MSPGVWVRRLLLFWCHGGHSPALNHWTPMAFRSGSLGETSSP